MATLRRMPPPPPIAANDPVFNRWLHDLTAFIAQGAGGIDTGQIPGYDALAAMVEQNTSDITSLTNQVTTNTEGIALNSAHIADNTAAIATLNARSQVLHGTVAPAAGLGVNGDWYSDTAAKHIYVKSSGAWVLIV